MTRRPASETRRVTAPARANTSLFNLRCTYGAINVYILDPYTIALSKIDRGFDTDIEDIIFLIRQDLITLAQLETVVSNAVVHAQEFDLNPTAMREHLQDVRSQLLG